MVKRILWVCLLVLAAGMLFVALPYQLIQGQFKASYMLGIAFWIGVGMVAYTRVFHPAIAAQEGVEREEQRLREAAPRRKARRIGVTCGLIGLPVLAGVMFGQGAEAGVVAFMALLGAIMVGLLAWGLAGVLINESGR